MSSPTPPARPSQRAQAPRPPVPRAPRLAALAQVQPVAVAHLTQALAGPRQAHAFLLVGGKASHAPQVAQALVASLVCSQRAGRDACGTCPSCRRFVGGHHQSVHVLAAESGSITIQQVRALRQKLALTSQDGAAMVVHLPAAGTLVAAAQQALLKTLEEPVGATTFVLVAEHAGALLATLRARLQVLWLGQRDEAGARQKLRQGGVPPQLADWAAPLVGDDVAAAERLIDDGLAQVIERTEQALRAGDDVIVLARLAQELGQDRPCFELALGALALHLRDALLGRLGADLALQRSPKSHPLIGHVATNQLCAAADALQALRRANVANINRPLALEGLFLLLNQSVAS